jgi:acetyl-CoA carboxylase biotin carboxylase subunit
MFQKILIANRGEIALRIIRACKELGIRTVIIHSEADSDSIPVRFADENVCVGSALTSSSYLNIPQIISSAEITGADAVHPGYGFLAENADFAEVCESCGIHFVGPPSRVIREMGDKIAARKRMEKAGVPIIPGSDGEVATVEEARAVAESIGFPLLIKATAGGGGKGMRVVSKREDLASQFSTAKHEAASSFGNDGVYIERFLQGGRHIEFQILGDSQGNIIYLVERDCTLQRRHQKLLEESPSTGCSGDLRRKMGEVAVKGAKHIGYSSAGTVEFLATPDEKFYFIEMNTRIQVEHPITEMITGLDLIKEQIRLKGGGLLELRQDDVTFSGHAIECRINAEDYEEGFRPCPGEIRTLHLPGGLGVRVDTHLHHGCTVSPYYDSLLAKVIVHGQDRNEARLRMIRALEEFTIEGVKTTVPFHLALLKSDDFRDGSFDTTFVNRFLKARNRK